MKIEIVNRNTKKRRTVWVTDIIGFETELDGFSIYSRIFGWLCFHGDFKVSVYPDEIRMPNDNRPIIRTQEELCKKLKVTRENQHYRN